MQHHVVSSIYRSECWKCYLIASISVLRMIFSCTGQEKCQRHLNSLLHITYPAMMLLNTDRTAAGWVCGSVLFRLSVIAEMLPLTLTARFGSVPLWSLAVSHDTRQSGVALQQVASFTMECHHRAQLVVRTHSCTIHHISWIKTCFPQFCYHSKGNKEQWQTLKIWDFCNWFYLDIKVNEAARVWFYKAVLLKNYIYHICSWKCIRVNLRLFLQLALTCSGSILQRLYSPFHVYKCTQLNLPDNIIILH